MAKSPDNGLAGAATKPPNGMDEGTLIAIVSLIISILSTLVCIGQVMQQYAGTAQAIRLCDGIVYGGRNGLPGRGARPSLLMHATRASDEVYWQADGVGSGDNSDSASSMRYLKYR